MKVLSIKQDVASSGPSEGEDIIIITFQSPAAGDIGRREFGAKYAGRDMYAGNGVKASYVFNVAEFEHFCEELGIEDPENCEGTEIPDYVTTLTLQDTKAPGFFQPEGMEHLGWRRHSIAAGNKFAIVTDLRNPELQQASIEFAQERREADRLAEVAKAAERKAAAAAAMKALKAEEKKSKAAPKAAK